MGQPTRQPVRPWARPWFQPGWAGRGRRWWLPARPAPLLAFLAGLGLGAVVLGLAVPGARPAVPLLAGVAFLAALWRCAGPAEPRGGRPVPERLETRNRHLQILLQAGRAMGAELDLERALTAVVDQVSGHTRFTRACVILGPDDEGEFRLGAARGLSREHLEEYAAVLRGPLRSYSPAEWARQTLQPVVVDDVAADFRLAPLRVLFERAGIGALICVPMVVQERFTGTLTVCLDRSAVLDTAEVSLVVALAGQAALAVEHARLYTLTAASYERLDKAVEFLENVASALAHSEVGVPPLLQLVAQATARLFSPAAVNLTIGEGGAGSWHITESSGIDLQAAAASRWDRHRPGSPWPVAIALPINLDGRQLGHFEICLAGEGRKVDSEERRILQAFVHLAASALGNASLVQDLRRAVDEAERAYMGTLEALTRALEMRDHETEGHSRRVVQYTLALARQLGVPERQLVAIMRGALLHDIGKIGTPDHILRKPAPLTPEEWEIMKTHTRIGYEMLYPIDFLREATPIILHHHERFDGSGYPDGLFGQTIPLGARIFAVADAYDALTSDRPYRKGRGHAQAVAEIERCAGSHFDPEVVAALLALPEEELARIRGLDLGASPVS